MTEVVLPKSEALRKLIEEPTVTKFRIEFKSDSVLSEASLTELRNEIDPKAGAARTDKALATRK
jgi:hypothetical protein